MSKRASIFGKYSSCLIVMNDTHLGWRNTVVDRVEEQ